MRNKLSFLFAIVLVCAAAFSAPALHAQAAIGSSNEATADPTVPRPNIKPCTVNLFTNYVFDNFNEMPFTYTAPAGCKGPFSKIVLTGDFYISPGIQYDRTAQIFLNNVNIFFGTTPEPLFTDNNYWHVERDLTDYASMFTANGSGEANIGNLVNDTYTGIIYGTMNVELYPTSPVVPPVTAADAVYALPNSSGSAGLNNSNPSFTTTVTLPTNIENAYLDIIAQSQNDEEQWFYCLSNTYAGDFGDCGNTGFREVEVSIDGTLAGVAPVYPWIYTGGLDPYLWIPIPGLQTLNFKPYRVDLSPFAGMLSNGESHNVTIEVYNAFEYFNVNAALLVYEDHKSQQVSGEVTQNTLTLPNPTVTDNFQTDGQGNFYGTEDVSSQRSFTISGYANTSHGKVTTTITQNINFANNQYLFSGNTQYTQNSAITSTVASNTQTTANGKTTTTKTNYSYPFVLNLTETLNTSNDNIQQPSNVSQGWIYNSTTSTPGVAASSVSENNTVVSTDNLLLVYEDGGYYIGGNSGQSSSQTYRISGPGTYCYNGHVAAISNVLTQLSSSTTQCTSGSLPR